MRFTRNHLIAVVFTLLIANLVWRWMAGWGLITIAGADIPLDRVVRTFERQGGIRLLTNLPAGTTATMNLKRAPVPEALETLAAITDSRWTAAYVLGPSRMSVQEGIRLWPASVKDGAWKIFQTPFGVQSILDQEEADPQDPRSGAWILDPGDSKDLHTILQRASAANGVAFLSPTSWNPGVENAPRIGVVSKAVKKLAGNLGGKSAEVILLSGGGRRGPNPDSTSGPPREDRGARLDWQAAGEQIQARINQLPPGERGSAQAEFDRRREAFQGMADLTPEQRAERMREVMSDPAIQTRMMDRMDGRDSRRTPEQRLERYRRYVERREQRRNASQ